MFCFVIFTLSLNNLVLWNLHHRIDYSVKWYKHLSETWWNESHIKHKLTCSSNILENCKAFSFSEFFFSSSFRLLLTQDKISEAPSDIFFTLSSFILRNNKNLKITIVHIIYKSSWSKNSIHHWRLRIDKSYRIYNTGKNSTKSSNLLLNLCKYYNIIHHLT